MHNCKYLLVILQISVLAVSVVKAEPFVNYTGDIVDSQTGTSKEANANSIGASAEVGMEYVLPGGVALGLFVDGDITSTEGAPILGGRYNASLKRKAKSNFKIANKEDVLNDLIKDGNDDDEVTNTETIMVNGVVYSSTGMGLLEVEPQVQGGADNIPLNSLSVKFYNQTNTGSIDIAFKGTFEGQTLSNLVGNQMLLTNTGNTTMDFDNRGNFSLVGDVIEGSFTSQDEAGIYSGELNITIINL